MMPILYYTKILIPRIGFLLQCRIVSFFKDEIYFYFTKYLESKQAISHNIGL